MISVERLSKSYRRSGRSVQALSEVTLEIPAGQFVAVYGPSGSGKTTLLFAVGGLLAPDAGQVRVAGQDPYALSPEERARFRAGTVGFVFQQFYLVPYLTVGQNILCPALAGSGDGSSQRAEELMARFGLNSRRDHLPSELSTGEKQRVALARAMLNRPKVLLADEPTGNLDEDNGRIVVESLREYTREGGAVLMVTHERQWAQDATRSVRLEAGRLREG